MEPEKKERKMGTFYHVHMVYVRILCRTQMGSEPARSRKKNFMSTKLCKLLITNILSSYLKQNQQVLKIGFEQFIVDFDGHYVAIKPSSHSSPSR
jgi:hypothetical protein